MAQQRRTGPSLGIPSPRIADFRPSPSNGAGFASGTQPTSTKYLLPDQILGEANPDGLATKEPRPALYGVIPKRPSRLRNYNFDLPRNPGSTMPDTRFIGGSAAPLPPPRLPQTADPEDVVTLHSSDRVYGTEPVEYISREKADEFVSLQVATDKGMYHENLGQLTPTQRTDFFEALWAAGAFVFVVFFVARHQRGVWPSVLFSVLTILGAFVQSTASIILIVGLIDFNLRSFLLFCVIYFFFVVGLGLALTGLEYGRKNTDLSPWHRKAMFMPILMAVIMSLLSIITLAVHNKVDGSAVDRTSIEDYTSLAFCMAIMVISPVVIGRELVPALVSAIYPECEGPEMMSLAPEALRRLTQYYVDSQSYTGIGSRPHRV